METIPEPDVVAADGALHRLDPRWIGYRRRLGWMRTAIAALLLGGAALLAVWAFDVHAAIAGGAAGAIVIALGVAAHAWPPLAYHYASYRMGRHALEIRRGLLWRSVIDVPRSRIQHSDVSQGPLERRFGLATFSVYTAGMRHAGVRLHGLAHDRALELREQLMQSYDDDVI